MLFEITQQIVKRRRVLPAEWTGVGEGMRSTGRKVGLTWSLQIGASIYSRCTSGKTEGMGHWIVPERRASIWAQQSI